MKNERKYTIGSTSVNRNPFTLSTCVIIYSSLLKGETHEQIAVTLNRDVEEFEKMLEESKKSGLYDQAVHDVDKYRKLHVVKRFSNFISDFERYSEF